MDKKNKTKRPCGDAGPRCFRRSDPGSDGGITHVAVCPVCNQGFQTSRYHSLPLHECRGERPNG